MIANRQLGRWGVLAAALLQLIAPPAWGQSKKAPTKKTATAPPPVVQPTASEGSTAFSLTTSVASDFLPSLVSILNATQAQRAWALSLGVLVQGRPNTPAATF